MGGIKAKNYFTLMAAEISRRISVNVLIHLYGKGRMRVGGGWTNGKLGSNPNISKN